MEAKSPRGQGSYASSSFCIHLVLSKGVMEWMPKVQDGRVLMLVVVFVKHLAHTSSSAH